MTNTNMSNANTEVNFNRMSDIAERDGKAGELYQNIVAAFENGDSLDEVLVLETKLDELKAARPDYKYIPDMEECITEARENAEQYAEYEAIKAEIIASTGDEFLAEDIAWDLAYSSYDSAEQTAEEPAIDFNRFPKAYDMIHAETTKEQRQISGFNSTVKAFA